MSQPNDLIIRVTRNDSGKYSHEVMIGLSDEAMLPELEKLAEYINKCLLSTERKAQNWNIPVQSPTPTICCKSHGFMCQSKSVRLKISEGWVLPLCIWGY